jgi:methionyl-tRNA formyltransferase
MRLILMGSGEFGVPTFAALAEDRRFAVAQVVTQPDRPAGRQRQLTPTPVAAWAAACGLPVMKPENVNLPEVIAALRAVQAQAAVVIAFGQKLSPELLAATGELTINLHASLLPKYRGAAPINWAIIRGETETGLSVIALAQRMDAGAVYGQCVTRIDPLETAGELHDRLAALGPALVSAALDQFERGELAGQAQDETKATQAPKLKKSDGVIDWSADAATVRNRVHGLTPWPGVSVRWWSGSEERTLMLRRVAAEPAMRCGPPPEGSQAQAQDAAPPGTVLEGGRVRVGHAETIRLLEVQAPGSRPMTIQEFMRGHALRPGDRLG